MRAYISCQDKTILKLIVIHKTGKTDKEMKILYYEEQAKMRATTCAHIDQRGYKTKVDVKKIVYFQVKQLCVCLSCRSKVLPYSSQTFTSRIGREVHERVQEDDYYIFQTICVCSWNNMLYDDAPLYKHLYIVWMLHALLKSAYI